MVPCRSRVCVDCSKTFAERNPQYILPWLKPSTGSSALLKRHTCPLRSRASAAREGLEALGLCLRDHVALPAEAIDPMVAFMLTA